MPLKEVDHTMKQNPESWAERDRIRADFERISNASSPNPRYQGKSPLEIARALLRPTKKAVKGGEIGDVRLPALPKFHQHC